jgi:hypothetical protein
VHGYRHHAFSKVDSSQRAFWPKVKYDNGLAVKMTAVTVAEARRALTHVVDHQSRGASALRHRGDAQERAVVDFIKIRTSEDPGAILKEVHGRRACDGHDVQGGVAVNRKWKEKEKGEKGGGRDRAYTVQRGTLPVPLYQYQERGAYLGKGTPRSVPRKTVP